MNRDGKSPWTPATAPLNAGGDTETVLAAAAGSARYAPSIHNTQPWLWEVGATSLALRAERDRQLSASDPGGRMLTISCGASLLYARAAIQAQGRRPVVSRFPDPRDRDLLATVMLADFFDDVGEDLRRFRALMARQTDRRPPREPAPSPQQVSDMVAAAETEGCHLHLLRREQVVELAGAAEAARSIDSDDDRRQQELADWVGSGHTESEGIPESVIPGRGGRFDVTPRFPAPGRPGNLPIDDIGGDAAAAYFVLFTNDDDPLAWLRAGEALSQVWAAAIAHELAVMPLSSVVELAGPRLALYRILSNIGHPQLVLRVGNTGDTGVPLTGRRAAVDPADVRE